jgi:hypothetical protein
MLEDSEIGTVSQIADIQVDIWQHYCQYNKYIYPGYHYKITFI